MVILETDRLLIRNFKPEDWRDLREYLLQKELFVFEHEWNSSEEGCRGAAESFSYDNVFWAVELKSNDKMIGHIYFNQSEPQEFLNWELGYIFNATYHGKGYATEACRRLVKYAFEELGAHRVSAKCSPENEASWKLLERIPMRREGHCLKAVTLKQTLDGQPIWWDELIYAVLAEEWKN